MHKTTFFKVSLLALIFLQGFISYSQDKDFVVFKSRYTKELKGDMLIIGNNILGKDNNSLDDSSLNQNISMEYIDIDGDNNTFSSSSANLIIPNSTSVAKCSKIVYAGLYWGAILQSVDRTDINKIKLKLPGNTAYNNITGELIYDAYSTPIGADLNRPYACYADVTDLLTNLPNAQGIYTVADVTSSLGINGSTGFAAGWTLFVVYEDLTATTKYINSFDGFSALANRTLEIKIDGFIIPSGGDVNLQYGFASLGGDKGQAGSKTKINTKFINATVPRPSNQFFSSSISDVKGYLSGRVPNSTNTLGYDTGIEQILRAAPSSIGYNDTNAKINLEMSSGQNIQIFSFFNAFAVDAIVPDIDLVKIVEDVNGIDIGGTEITLGQDLYYKITFKSIGSDQVTDFTLEDIIPENVVFNYPADVILPDGMTIANNVTYDAATRRLLFKIPDNLVKIGDLTTIRLHVKVVDDYNALSTACSSEIKNIAIANYRGLVNNKYKTESSFNSTACNFGAPSSTNFLANIDGHTFTRTVQLCNSAVLTASNGYDSYSWSTSPTGTPVVSTSQNFTVTETGTYYVSSISNSTCKSIKEEITVIPYGNITNPVIPYADEVVTCPNNGKELPYIFLCGANASKSIQTNIAGATIVWEKLNESSCPPIGIDDCANENVSCTWTEVGQGPNYIVNTKGQFRVTINSGGCFSRFYFNVYQNLLSPTETHNDIICNTPGKITIDDVPEGYEYSLDAAGPYQDSNIFPNAAFPVLAAGSYTVYIKQKGVATNPCIFSVPNILIRKRNFSGSTIVTQPLCNGDKGTIKITANDADPQYYYSIYKGVTLVKSVGPISDSYYEFESLNPGTYTVRVWTNDGCDYSKTIEIIEPPLLTATSGLTKSLTCVDGEITVYPVGGNPPYVYYVNGSTISQNIPKIVVSNPLPSGGVYTIDVFDSKNCKTTTTIAVAAIAPPVYDVTQTDVKCYGTNSGEIKFDVTNNNGYSLFYGISTDNGLSYTYGTDSTISNLAAGDYYVNLKYSLDGSDCLGTPEKITITEPAAALTASAGVSELAGCLPTGEGKIRITNPQGGTPFAAPNLYKYSFDGGTTWINTNEANLMSGTYTVYIKDANGCIFPMVVTLDPQPPAPTITVDYSAFNCDGKATATVTVTNEGGANYEYEYLLDGKPNPNTANPKVFLNVASGPRTITVNYKLVSVPTYSNLLFEDFGSGSDVTSPGINPAFCFERQVEATKCNGDKLFGNGEYTVTNSLKNNPYDGWHNPVDHTKGSASGRYLAVDAGTAIPNNAVLYRKTIKDIIPGQPIQVRFFATNLLKIGNTQPDASLTVELQNSTGQALSSQSTGGIPKTNGWVEYNRSIDPGRNTTLDFVLRLEIAQVNGIDFAVDDIEVYQLPKSCITEKEFKITVPTDKAFTASIVNVKNLSCSGSNDGEITIAATNFDTANGFQYSIDNGATWNTQMTSPYTITGLAPATYNLKIRYGATAGNTCEKSFTSEITAPTPLIVMANLSSPASCSGGATISASSTGGTPLYRYELWNDTATTNIVALQTSSTFTNVVPGSYIVRGYDANNCTDDSGVITVVAPPTLSATLDPSTDFCYDNLNQATLVVSPSGGTAPFVYSLDGAPSQSTNTFTNVTPGTHEIVVTDSYNCTATIANIIIAPQLTAAVSNIKELDCTASPDAVITVSINGGNSPFTYKVKEGSANYGPSNTVSGNSFTYTTATANTYTFEITDAQGCVTTTSAIINPLVPLDVTLSPVNPLCFGDSNGSVQIVPSGGVGPYTYSIDGTNYLATSQFPELAAGDYTFYIKDVKECFITKNIILTEPSALTTTAAVTSFSCSATNTKQVATITITATGGTGSYQYSFYGGGYTNVNTLTVNDNGNDQTIPYSVRDTNGCPVSGSVTLLKLNSPTDLNFTSAAITCSATTTTVTVDATNGVGTPTYEIISPAATAPSNTDGIFADLAPGTYIFKVTDENGCYYTESYVINQVTPIAVSGNVTSDVLCNGDNTGSAVFTVSGFSTSENYTVTVSTIPSGLAYTQNQSGDIITLTNLAEGTYTIDVLDNDTACPATASVTITEPVDPLTLSATASNTNCNNDNALISVTANGGTQNYSYAAVVSGATAPTTYTTNNIVTVDTNSGANMTWDVYVKDANGCTEMRTVTITTDPKPTITASVTNQCASNGSSFTIDAVGNGGVGTLYYSIGSGFQTSPTFTVTTPGDYTVTVRDANLCTASTIVTVYPVITPALVLTKDLTCSLPSEATVNINANGGSGSFTYQVSFNGGAYSTTGLVGNVFTTANPGTYQFLITDGNGCTLTKSITINPIVPPVITSLIQTQQIYCNSDTTGAIKVNIDATKGTAPFTYSIDGTTFQTSSTFTGLAAGTYTVTMRDSKGCEATDNIIINEPTPIVIDYDKEDLLCIGAGVTKGKIIIKSVAGGTPNYEYYVTGINNYYQHIPNNPGSSVVFEVVDFGLYQIRVVDANGCSAFVNDVKIASPPDNLEIDITQTADCINKGTALVKIGTALSSSGPFHFNIYTGGTQTWTTDGVDGWQGESSLGSKETTFTGLTPGVTYTFIVYDEVTDCYYYQTAETPIPTASSLAIDNLIPKNITCTGSNDGNVSFDIKSTYSSAVNIKYEIFEAFTNSTTLNSGTGTITAGGTLTISNAGTLPVGSFYILVEETSGSNSGCSIVSSNFNIKESPVLLSLTATVIQNANCNEDGIVSAQAKDGTAPYSFIISTSATQPSATDTWSSSSTFNVPANDYYVHVKDAYGCIKTSTVQTVPLDPSPEIALTVTDNCVDEGNYEITVSETTAGIAPYSISVNNSAFQNGTLPYTLSNLNSGDYTITIRDLNGCTDTQTITLYKKLSINPEVTKELDCTTTSPDAEITLNVSNGFGPFTYEVSTDGGLNYGSPSAPFAGPSVVHTAATAGTYTFRITDANGCQFIATAIVEPTITPDFTFIQTDETCIDSENGTITITATAGVGPFTYSINNGTSFEPSNFFTGLSASGTYNIIVKDSNDCDSAPKPTTIGEPTAVSGTGTLTQGLSCGAGNATQPALVTVNGSGGTGSYTYSFNGAPYTSNNTYSTYSSGTVTALVKDSNGCISAVPIEIDVPPLNPPTDIDFNPTAVTCIVRTSDVTLTTTKGTLPLSYTIIFPSSATTNTTGASTGIFTGLAPDTYLFEVKDANGCTYQEAYTVDPVTNISVAGQLISDVSCNGSANGEVQFTVANFEGTYNYTLTPASGTPPTVTNNTGFDTIRFTGLAAGTYTIAITDNQTGCPAQATVTVSEPAPLALTPNPFINANCNFGAQVSVTATGGIAPYSYSFVPSGNIPASTDYTINNSVVLDPIISTNWDVWVKDANGCIISTPLPITIATDPLPTVTVDPYSQCPSASGEYTFTVSTTGGVGPFEYSIGSGFTTNPTFTVNASGSYDVTVRDKNGCTTTVNGLVNIAPALQLTADITALPSCADGDGALTLLATGGSGPYEYSLDGGTPQSTADFTNLSAGPHTATVRDVTTNCTFSIQVSLEAATRVTDFALSKTDVSCNGVADGTITATIATPAVGINDNPIYTYQIIAPIVGAIQTSPIFQNLAAGTYTIEVTSGRGCTAPETITIGEPAPITVPTPIPTQFGCAVGTNGTNYATITVNGVAGGSNVYTIYEFFKVGNPVAVQRGSSNSYTETDYAGGSYTVKVYDDNNCIGSTTAPITIDSYTKLDKINVAVTRAIDCNNPESITATALDPAGNAITEIDYVLTDAAGIVPSQTSATGTFTGLSIGNYIITATNPVTACGIQTVHYVNNPNTFVLKAVKTSDVICFGSNEGTVELTLIDNQTNLDDEAGAFSYILTKPDGTTDNGNSPDKGPFTLTGLTAGLYSVTATLENSPFCSASTSFTIVQPAEALDITETHTAITCVAGNNDGSISVSATGGWSGGYEFELVGPVNVAYSTQSNFTNLTAGSYTINVRDSKGCIATTTVTLKIPDLIVVSATPSTAALDCYGDTSASITVNSVTGGSGSYLYTLQTLDTAGNVVTSNGPQQSTIFPNLGAGDYVVKVTDSWNCSAVSSTFTISEPTKVVASLAVKTTQTCDNLTVLELSATGGTPPYTYSTDPNFTTSTPIIGSSVTFSVPVGTYHYYVRDAKDCTSYISNDIKIDPLEPLMVNLDIQNAVINCKGDNTGVIVAHATGGLGNYIYTLLDGAGTEVSPNPVQTTPGRFADLFTGFYQVKVESEDCKAVSTIIEIKEPETALAYTPNVTDVTCSGEENGKIEINASGGTGQIKYAISPRLDQFFDSGVFDELAVGSYQVVIQDEKGCFIVYDFEIKEPMPLMTSTIVGSIVEEICAGDKDGAFSIAITGGTLPYSVSLDDPNGTYTTGTATQTEFDFTDLSGGNHFVFIRDANGCTADWLVALPESINMNPIAVVQYDCVNNAAVNTVTISIDDSITDPTDVDYALDGSADFGPSNVFTDLAPGSHFVTARHGNGCEQQTMIFDIIQIDPLKLVLNDGGLNEVVAVATGGGGGYTYTLNGESYGSTSNFIIYKSGEYTITVADANGCVASVTKYMEHIDVCIPNYFTPNGDGVNDGWAPGCTENYKNLLFSIFDRYGRKVGEYRTGQYWDGKYNGAELPSGDYWYVLRLNDMKDAREFVGHFTLYR